MSGNRAFRVAATSARVATGVAVAVACVIGVVAAIHAPWPVIRHDPAQVEVTSIPGDTVLVCNGDLRALGRDSSAPLDMRSAAAPRLTEAGSSGAPSTRTLEAPDLVDAGEVRVLTGAVQGRTAPMIAAAESVAVAEDDLTGFAALACGEPRLESWLVGGNVGTGTEDIVILTNAGQVPTTVTLSVYGTSRSVRTVVVPAETQSALPLASIAAGNETPVVRVEAVGAPVRAVLQSSLVQVLDPAGIDLQDAVAGAQRNVVLTGVQAFPVEGDEADMTVLRLLSPESDAQASIVVRPIGSGGAGTEFAVPLTAETPAEVSLSGLAPGTYTVEVEADSAVVAAVRQQDGSGLDSDFAWVTPAPEIDSEVLVAVPEGPTAQLQLANTSDDEATVALERVDGGETEEIVVPAGESVSVDVDSQTTYRLRPSSTVHAAVTMTESGGLAVLPVQPGAGAEQAITVYP
ncbi:DUF5719 family protein [Microbacterium sp. SA39]|uniref:DUF5719 family protein n=1 Tax=Microbacterium sp. SA39 TaxID=1263625 RepID=UPI0005FA265C|nr:DUF5719 family protein [Microbacterium sp. SA39]KJQ53681.1 hypothetical protein RS85_02713 [Microbacterium sp. SA39]